MNGGPLLADGLHDLPAGKIAAIVTSLEMRRPPPAHPVERPAGCRLRRVQDPRPDWYRDLFRRVGAPWLWTSRLTLGEAALATLLADPAVEIHALEREGRDEGLLELDFRAPEACEIAFFGLSPAASGRGIGRWMMAHALRQAWSRPIRRLWVHTCSLDHPAALAFYIRSGFTPFRQQVEVADDPRALGVLPPDAAPRVPRL